MLDFTRLPELKIIEFLESPISKDEVLNIIAEYKGKLYVGTLFKQKKEII